MHRIVTKFGTEVHQICATLVIGHISLSALPTHENKFHLPKYSILLNSDTISQH